MKFTAHLTSHVTPEWRKQYIDYEELKNILYRTVEQLENDRPQHEAIMIIGEQKFFQLCHQELVKVDTFFFSKVNESVSSLENLRNELIEWGAGVEMKPGGTGRRFSIRAKTSIQRKQMDLKMAFSELYLSLVLLQNYQHLNTEGFRKILKKHDKILGVDTGSKWMEANVIKSYLYVNRDIDKTILDTENLVTNILEGGNRQKAMKLLRVPTPEDKLSSWLTFKVGLFSGAFVILLLNVVIAYVKHPPKGDWTVTLKLFRGPFLLTEFLYLIGANVYGWRTNGVNHVLIFELDPRYHLSEQHLLEIASISGIIWSISVLAFVYSYILRIPAFAIPLVLNFTLAMFILNPIRIFRHRARFWFVRVMMRIFASPFYYVSFADFWMADQLTSLVLVIVDFAYMLCYYIHIKDWHRATENVCISDFYYARLVIVGIPVWFRLAQCLRRFYDTRQKFPHLANAFKYMLAIIVIILSHLYTIFTHHRKMSLASNPYFFIWLFLAIITASFSYAWDIRMDWGLCVGDNNFLREETVYSPHNSRWFYYVAMVGNLILRTTWIISMTLIEATDIHGEIIITISSVLEIFRRFVWNFFRLENEHLNNCGKFKAVRDITVTKADNGSKK